MTHHFKRVAVTGGAGHIGYNLLFRIAHGDLFGKDTRIALNILEIPEMVPHLEGIKMELEDCAFPLLQEIKIGYEPQKMFKEVDLAILIGAKPRGPGMERKDLLLENAKIFLEQGNALNQVANKDCKVLVVGNPCNTNCWIARTRVDRLQRDNFYAMMRLDQNRATALLAHKAGVEIADVKNVIIWGNHSSTQVPDYFSATIKGKPVTEVIKDRKWLEEDFVKAVQQRGAEIIKVRGKSSSASAAHAIIDTVKDIYYPTPNGSFYSLAVSSKGNPYGIREGLIFSFPCRTTADGKVEIVQGLKVPNVEATENELIDEQGGQIALMTRI